MMESKAVVKRLSVPASLSVVLAMLYLALAALNSPWMNSWLQAYLLAALVVSAGVTLVRAANLVLFDIFFRRRKGREASQLLRMVVATVGYAALFIAVFTLVFKKNLSGVMATSAVLTVILGLALQDTLGNFFAGISLHIEEPYHIGDALRIGDVVGRVESVTWRTTSVRTDNNSLVVYPNSRIARDPIEIYSLNAQNRRVMRFPGPYSHRPEKIIGMIRDAVESVPRISRERKPLVRIADFADSSVTYQIAYWVKDYMWAPEIDAEIRKRIWYVFLRNGLEIPFPVRQVLLEQRQAARPIDQEDYAACLSSVEILKPLSPEELEEVARALVRHIYAPGEFVVRKGESGSSMFIVRHGRAEVLIEDADGCTQQLALLAQDDVIGEMSLFTGEPRSADVRALDELEVLEIRKPVMERLLRENAGLAQAFSLLIAERQAQLAERVRHTAGEDRHSQSQSILSRIKRFFSL